MLRTVHVVFDGEVLRPEEPLDLQANGRYRITVEEAVAPKRDENGQEEYPLSVISELATDMGVPDLAERHDDYAHGR